MRAAVTGLAAVVVAVVGVRLPLALVMGVVEAVLVAMLVTGLLITVLGLSLFGRYVLFTRASVIKLAGFSQARLHSS